MRNLRGFSSAISEARFLSSQAATSPGCAPAANSIGHYLNEQPCSREGKESPMSGGTLRRKGLSCQWQP